MRASLVLLAAMVTVTYAVGQYYVPRSYYTIDSDGHETAPVPLRRLRRSAEIYGHSGSSANANADARAHADSNGGNANANANANANSYTRGTGTGVYRRPGGLGSSNPNILSSGMTRSQSGPVQGHSVTATSDVAIDSSGHGYYGLSTSVDN